MPARETSLGSFLQALHLVACCSTFIKIVNYILVRAPIKLDELVDSLEIFSGVGNYTKVSFTGVQSLRI